MKFIPRAVMIGFVNALAILIFMAQVPHFWGISATTYIFVGITLAIVYIVPLFFRAIPAPLIAIFVLTAVTIFSGIELRTVGDLGTINQSLPTFLIPDVPFNLETLSIIFPYSIALAIVGLLESLLTASIVDDMTATSSNKNKEARGQGVANIVTGFFGGMAGCAMIGQSVINVKSGGRGRLSSLVAGVFLIFLIIVLGDLVVQIPMPVLVGIMIMVSVGTFDWTTFNYLRKAPRTDALVMLVTVAIVVATHDLSKGVIAGVILSAVFFVTKISRIKVHQYGQEQKILYKVEGPLFFASVDNFIHGFDLTTSDSHIVIDFSNSQVWDDSGVGAIDKIIIKLRQNNNNIQVKGMDSYSKRIVDKLAIYNDANAKLSTH